jgi:hypothetical protein
MPNNPKHRNVDPHTNSIKYLELVESAMCNVCGTFMLATQKAGFSFVPPHPLKDCVARIASDVKDLWGAMSKIKITEHGWPGHYILGHRCQFRRNTHLTHDDGRCIVVSTVGNRRDSEYGGGMIELGHDRHYETMAFVGYLQDGYYIEADTSREIGSGYAGLKYTEENEDSIDNLADEMHDRVVDQIHDNFDQAYAEGLAYNRARNADY